MKLLRTLLGGDSIFLLLLVNHLSAKWSDHQKYENRAVSIDFDEETFKHFGCQLSYLVLLIGPGGLQTDMSNDFDMASSVDKSEADSYQEPLKLISEGYLMKCKTNKR